MEIIVLGSGSYAPGFKSGRPVRNPAGYAVKIRKEVIIFDFGFGNLRNLARAGMDIADISHVFLSHFHLDHWGDVPALLFLFHYDFKPKSGTLKIVGPKGIKKLIRSLSEVCRPYLAPSGYKLKVSEIKEGSPYRSGDWSVKAKKVKHSDSSVCYRLDYAGKSMTYTGDASYEDTLAEFARKSDILISDCTFPGPEAKYGHMTVDQVIELAEKSRSKKTLLSHISPQAESAVAARLNVMPGAVLAGADLMRLKI